MGISDFLENIFGSKPNASKSDVRLEDINSIFNAIAERDQDGAFVVFMPSQPRTGEKDVLNIQFSIEEGNVGLDWVLISPVNILEEKRFLDICKSH